MASSSHVHHPSRQIEGTRTARTPPISTMLRLASRSVMHNAGVAMRPRRAMSASIDKIFEDAQTSGGIDRLFKGIDNNGDGVIQPGELQGWLKSNGLTYTPAEVYAMYAQHDDNNDGVLQKDEFAELLRHVRRTRELKASLNLRAKELGIIETHLDYCHAEPPKRAS